MIHKNTNVPAKKRSLGQNFLKDKNIAAKIVSHLNIQPDDNILEIGPGAGALTSLIAKANPASLVLLEKDRYWAMHHAAIAKDYCYSYQPILIDALTFDWKRLKGDWKIAGNLPYNIASPLIWDIVYRTKSFGLAVFMVQKEVGQRIASMPGTKEYGALSVWVQSFSNVQKLFIVPPGAFDPRPKVDSMVISLLPNNEELLCKPEHLSELIKICFQQRRKQLRNILKHFWSDSLDVFFDKHGIMPSLRPESLSTKQFQILAKQIFEDNHT